MRADNVVLIVGPTASGKSALALVLAERLGGVAINADAMQVYRDLRILTARPAPEDETRAPHALYGFMDGAEAYSVGRYVEDAARAIEEARGARLVPIFVGGTGLYFRALLEGLSPIPPIPADIRDRWRAAAKRTGAVALHGVLSQRDRVMAARLHAGDTQRIVRALEVLDATGRSLAAWQEEQGEPLLTEAETARFVVGCERDELHRRCDARFDAMLRDGALDEAARLKARALDPALPVMRALGLRPLLRHLDGEIDLPDAIALAKTESRQYVKRQETWLGRQMVSWIVIETKQMDSSCDDILPIIQSSIDATKSRP